MRGPNVKCRAGGVISLFVTSLLELCMKGMQRQNLHVNAKDAYGDIKKRYVAHVEKHLFMLSDELYNPADKREAQ